MALGDIEFTAAERKLLGVFFAEVMRTQDGRGLFWNALDDLVGHESDTYKLAAHAWSSAMQAPRHDWLQQGCCAAFESILDKQALQHAVIVRRLTWRP